MRSRGKRNFTGYEKMNANPPSVFATDYCILTNVATEKRVAIKLHHITSVEETSTPYMYLIRLVSNVEQHAIVVRCLDVPSFDEFLELVFNHGDVGYDEPSHSSSEDDDEDEDESIEEDK